MRTAQSDYDHSNTFRNMSQLPESVKEMHKVLQKQISKYLPEKYWSDAEMQVFFSMISGYYTTVERDKKVTEHAFAISEKEYQTVVADITRKNTILHDAMLKLKEAIATLQPEAASAFDATGDDLSAVINYLMDLILKSKELEQQLIKAKDLAETASSAKSDFLSVMSHEIRTPLNAIIGYIHLLKQEDPLPSQANYLNILSVSARNLMSLINDVLDFGKIEEGKILFAESDLDLRKLVKDVQLANKIRADENGNVIKVMMDEDVPRYVKGDITRITQILNNLVSNAIKFTKNGRVTIELQLKSKREKYAEIQFLIKDTGMGISKENQKLIFERFTQAHSYITREYGGSGLGLTIIKKLLNLLDSEIHVESVPGQGSEFSFTLLFKESDVVADEVPDGIIIGDELKGKKILLVEDVEFNALLARRMLQRWEADVTHVVNGLLAVEATKANDFDMILMDVQMPVMDGITASTEIRKFNKDVVIIALTASTSPAMQEKFNLIGISGFVYKPIDADLLYKTLVRLSR